MARANMIGDLTLVIVVGAILGGGVVVLAIGARGLVRGQQRRRQQRHVVDQTARARVLRSLVATDDQKFLRRKS